MSSLVRIVRGLEAKVDSVDLNTSLVANTGRGKLLELRAASITLAKLDVRNNTISGGPLIYGYKADNAKVSDVEWVNNAIQGPAGVKGSLGAQLLFNSSTLRLVRGIFDENNGPGSILKVVGDGELDISYA